MMNKMPLMLLVLAAGTIMSLAEGSDLYGNIGQPSIFWRDGEWQMFQDGRWIPYIATKSAPAQLQTTPEMVPVPEPEPEAVDTNGVYYEWGYGLPLLRPIHHHRHSPDKARRFTNRNSGAKSLTDTAVGNIGRTTIGIGKQSGGIGQTTIGIGQPNGGIGQTTIGIGQPTIGIGKPTIGIRPQVHAVETHSQGQSEHSGWRR
jgi:hypothetical protein